MDKEFAIKRLNDNMYLVDEYCDEWTKDINLATTFSKKLANLTVYEEDDNTLTTEFQYDIVEVKNTRTGVVEATNLMTFTHNGYFFVKRKDSNVIDVLTGNRFVKYLRNNDIKDSLSKFKKFCKEETEYLMYES